jgi:phosphoenolpyruvate carboxykinase (GTP)
MGPRVTRPPRIFRVNWFRKGDDGKFLWPGYGDNVRVLKWMVERIHGEAGEPEETPIGFIPRPDQLDTQGLTTSRAQLAEALRVDRGEWLQALSDLGEFYDGFGPRLPQPIADTLARTRRKLGA